MAEPRLLNPLRHAYAALYSPPSPSTSTSGHGSVRKAGEQDSRAANDFLVELQSRNVRRKILSLQQRFRDQQQKSSTSLNNNSNNNHHHRKSGGGGGVGTRKSDENGNEDIGSGTAGETGIQMGSSWLAFLAVLCQMHHDGSSFVSFPPERLFAAQSVLHRSRRNKLIDAIDLEVESDDIDETMALQMYHETNNNENNNHVGPMMEAYHQFMAQWNPFVLDVLRSTNHNNHSSSLEESSNEREEQIKGEIMIHTLAAISYITACQAETTPHRAPILEALGTTIATITLRIRYLKPSLETSDDGPDAASSSSSNQSLIWTISHAFQLVFDRAKAFHPDPVALATSLTVTLGALPDTILSSPGGARGKLSIDPRALETAIRELRTRGFQDLWIALQHIGALLLAHKQEQLGGGGSSHSNNNGTNGNNRHKEHHLLVLSTLEKWARFLCVPKALIDEIAGLLVASLSSDEPREQAVALLFLSSVFEGGGWTEEKVLSFNLGLSEHQLVHQVGKRKQSSRSKRRQKEMVSNKTTEDSAEQAQQEVIERGTVACHVAIAVWSNLRMLLRSVLDETLEESAVDGEGVIGCVATAAQSCLPFLLKCHNNNQHGPLSASVLTCATCDELFREIADALLLLCCSRNQTVRCLALSPLYALHNKVITVTKAQQLHDDDGRHESFALDILLQVCDKRVLPQNKT